ncbi:PAP 25A-associated domain-containing protein [Babesia ovis]|uniref:PAP 25A-associated domain-containing protein n=1 Tax=Babesia ovis TaxID=5869 RepID=A0A9W5WW23_BABOV|nr:PAP 25A-associated domain-containing protein [Babesia ovis]
MDWLRSALNQEDSSDEERLEETVTVSTQGANLATSVDIKEATTDDGGVKKADSVGLSQNATATKCVDKPVESKDSKETVPLFSLASTSRKVDDFSKAECIKINPPKPTEDLVEPPQISHGGTNEEDEEEQENSGPVEPSLGTTKTEGTLDTLEIMQRFNMLHSDGHVKAPKRGDWFGGNIRVTEIKADDLRMGKTEKRARYSTSKEALLEGRSAYKAPTRQLETDDGQLLTSNVMRKTSKRKHQISWLAADAQERELELLERTAQARKTKHETQMKYGW